MKLIDLRKCSHHDGPYFFAVEEYFLKKENETDDLFFTWTLDPCVVIGRHQVLESEVNQAFMKEQGFPIWRRPSGGGCVFADRGCIMFSFITTHQNNQYVFDHYLNRVIDAFKPLGLTLTFTGRNDLLCEGLKISGSSFYRYKNRVVLHGTLLYDVNIEHLVKAITPSDAKLISKGIASVRQRVMNIHDRVSLSKDDLVDYLSSTMCESSYYLSLDERKEIDQLARKYGMNEWIYDKNPLYTKENKGSFPAGNMLVAIDIKANKIANIRLTGDYFSLQPLEPLLEQYRGQLYTKEVLTAINTKFPISQYIYRMSDVDWHHLIHP